MDGYGNISWWGFSPAIDLFDFISHGKMPPKEVNVLLVNNHDPRNLIKTICNLRENREKLNSDTKINFYILEPFVEQVGRYMLMLNIILDSTLGLQEKIETFLEVYGNSFLRNPTAEYVTQQSEKFIECVTDLQKCNEVFPLYDLSLLKHKERDYLEGTFKFWRANDNRNFEMHKMWDYRNREYLGPRYDVKENTYDWDRTMRLQERGATIIHKTEYESYRGKGIAFESRSGDYNVPNRTISSPIVVTDSKADRVMKRGYFGDIVTGPFISFGVESSNTDLFKKANNMFVHTSLDVASYNLQQLLEKLSCHRKIAEEDACGTDFDCSENTENVSIKFVYGKDLKYFLSKEKFKQNFDLVFLASDSAQFLQESVLQILKPQSEVLVESPKFIVDLKKEQIASILQTLKKRGEDFGLEYTGNIINFDESPYEVNFLRFHYSP